MELPFDPAVLLPGKYADTQNTNSKGYRAQGKSRFTVVGTKIKFILILSLVHYCMIFLYEQL